MKTFAPLLVVILALSFSACKGPRGLPGLDGRDGESFLGTVFEIERDFTAANNYGFRYPFPDDFTMYDTDIVLVYLLWEVIEYNDGTSLDVWRLMPQTRIFNSEDGTLLLQYNFEYTFYDVDIFLEGDVDYTSLEDGDLKNQIFRIVVIPADFSAKAKINDYNSVVNSPELNINKIERVRIKELSK